MLWRNLISGKGKLTSFLESIFKAIIIIDELIILHPILRNGKINYSLIKVCHHLFLGEGGGGLG